MTVCEYSVRNVSNRKALKPCCVQYVDLEIIIIIMVMCLISFTLEVWCVCVQCSLLWAGLHLDVPYTTEVNIFMCFMSRCVLCNSGRGFDLVLCPAG